MIVLVFEMVQARSMTKKLAQLGVFTCFSSLDSSSTHRSSKKLPLKETIVVRGSNSEFVPTSIVDESVPSKMVMLRWLVPVFFRRLVPVCWKLILAYPSFWVLLAVFMPFIDYMSHSIVPPSCCKSWFCAVNMFEIKCCQ